MEWVAKAARIATHAHRLQYRKFPGADGRLRPYIEHPARVAGLVLQHQDDFYSDSLEDVVAAAWLHDVVEDTDCQQFYIDEMFSGRPVIAYLVRHLTNGSYGELNRAARKAKDRDRLRGVMPAAKLIKALDRLDNLRDMAGAEPSFIKLYCDESELLIDEVFKHELYCLKVIKVIRNEVEFLREFAGRRLTVANGVL
jgi:(p)ppGpp synthase/HD superfamily hydrolase